MTVNYIFHDQATLKSTECYTILENQKNSYKEKKRCFSKRICCDNYKIYMHKNPKGMNTFKRNKWKYGIC